MSAEESRKQQAKVLRGIRKIHRVTGLFLFVFFFVMAVTGIMLGLKKHSGGYIASKNHEGSSADLREWISLDSLHTNACSIIRDSLSKEVSLDLERIDIRKDKGMIKFIFENHFTAVQLDGKTGKLLHIENRRADFLEKIHDGAIVDDYFGWKKGWFKVVYCCIMGIALLVFTLTGFWMWYGPKRMRKA